MLSGTATFRGNFEIEFHDPGREQLRGLREEIWAGLPPLLGPAVLPQRLQGQLPCESSEGARRDEKVVRVPGSQDDALTSQGADLRVVTFNIGYGRGPAGDASGPWSEEQIRAGLDCIAAQIRETSADLVFLQEVDFESARSHDIDEGRYLLDATALRFSSCVVTWEKNYVPFPYWPPSKHYGAMKSGQCILSHFPIVESTRHRLPQLPPS